jgi:hypothetical protein
VLPIVIDVGTDNLALRDDKCARAPARPGSQPCVWWPGARRACLPYSDMAVKSLSWPGAPDYLERLGVQVEAWPKISTRSPLLVPLMRRLFHVPEAGTLCMVSLLTRTSTRRQVIPGPASGAREGRRLL